MRGLKMILAGMGLLISGSIGVGLGGLEQIMFISNTIGSYEHSLTFYVFSILILLGLILLIVGLFMKETRTQFNE